jgi:hypothetical protein
VGQQRPPAHGGDLVDQLSKAEAAQVVGDEQQRADRAAGAGRRRVEAGEGPGEAVELPGRFQLIDTPEGCHNTLADR